MAPISPFLTAKEKLSRRGFASLLVFIYNDKKTFLRIPLLIEQAPVLLVVYKKLVYSFLRIHFTFFQLG